MVWVSHTIENNQERSTKWNDHGLTSSNKTIFFYLSVYLVYGADRFSLDLVKYKSISTSVHALQSISLSFKFATTWKKTNCRLSTASWNRTSVDLLSLLFFLENAIINTCLMTLIYNHWISVFCYFEEKWLPKILAAQGAFPQIIRVRNRPQFRKRIPISQSNWKWMTGTILTL